VSNVYACFPVLDGSGAPVPDEGYEFVISVRGSVASDSTLDKVEVAVYQSFVNIVGALYQGQL